MFFVQNMGVCTSNQGDARLLAQLAKPAVIDDLAILYMVAYLKKTSVFVLFQEIEELLLYTPICLCQYATDAGSCHKDIVRSLKEFLERDPWGVVVMVVLAVKTPGNQLIQLQKPIVVLGNQDAVVVVSDFFVQAFSQISLHRMDVLHAGALDCLLLGIPAHDRAML